MKKLSCIVLKSDADKLIRKLQRLSCIEISAPEDDSLSLWDGSRASLKLGDDLQKVRRAIEFLQIYDQNRYSLFDPPSEASLDDFESGLDRIVLDIADKALALSTRLSSLQSKLAESEVRINALTPWEGVQCALPEQRTAYTVSIGGTLPPNTDILGLINENGSIEAQLDIIRESEKGATAVLLTFHKDRGEEVMRVMASYGFSKATVITDSASGYADGLLEKEKARLISVKKKLKDAKAEATALAKELPGLKALHDVLLTKNARIEAKKKTARTQRTAVICGWVPVESVEAVENILKEKDCAYSFDDPTDEDDVPVKLKNNSYARNFEPIMEMYALPKYRRFDPTFVMSVFYAVIFGLMFADVGYGAVLLCGCIAGLKLLHPKEGLRRMLTMFAFCSVSCMIGGVLFGGYFGDLPQALAKGFGGAENTSSTALLFDMIEEPMSFLVVALAVGAAHLLFGMGIQFYVLAKSGKILDAVFDVGSWFLLFAGIGVYFISSTAGLITGAAGALMLILTQGRHEKNIIMKLGKGIMSLYDIVSYASDLLSYSRVLALGLASAVIASVINLLGTMGGASVGGIIMFVAVFLIGHTINFLVNILGTYVHTSRLQYIEFFGKFFEAGGREFSPLKIDSKYVNLK